MVDEKNPEDNVNIGNAEKLRIAHQNFIKGMSHSDNAAHVKVSRQTISKWAKMYKWQEEQDALEEATRAKFIEQESDRIVKDTATVDKEHRAIVDKLRSEFKSFVMGSKRATIEDMNLLSAKIRVGSEILKLEREVLGLNKQRHIEKPHFPTTFNLMLQTKDGPVLIDPSKIGQESMSSLRELLPNQNPEVFGPTDSVNPVDEEAPEYYEQQEDFSSPTMRAIGG